MKICTKLIIFFSVAVAGIQPVSAEQKSITMVFDATDEVIAKGGPNVFINTDSSSEDICGVINKDTFHPHEIKKNEYKTLLENCGEERYISQKGDMVFVKVFYTESRPEPKITFSEKKRKTRISSDLTIIYDTLNPLTKDKKITPTPNAVLAVHTLSQERANLTVKVAYSNTETGADADTKQEYVLNIVTGPDEHWFLSVDLPVSNSKILKYDQNTSQLVEKNTPSSFYIGANYMLGDVLSDNLSWSDKLHAKFMLKASSKPLDSIGIGVGFRLNELSVGSKKLGATVIFVGSFWDKEDTLEGVIVRENDKYEQSWKIGISFSLDKLADWL